MAQVWYGSLQRGLFAGLRVEGERLSGAHNWSKTLFWNIGSFGGSDKMRSDFLEAFEGPRRVCVDHDLLILVCVLS